MDRGCRHAEPRWTEDVGGCRRTSHEEDVDVTILGSGLERGAYERSDQPIIAAMTLSVSPCENPWETANHRLWLAMIEGTAIPQGILVRDLYLHSVGGVWVDLT